MQEIDSWNRGFSIAIVVTFLVGHHSYTYDMSIVLLPLLITLDQMFQPDSISDRKLQVAVALMFFTPLPLLLMLRYSHQNLFALVVLALAAALAASSAKAKPAAWASTSKLQSSAQLR